MSPIKHRQWYVNHRLIVRTSGRSARRATAVAILLESSHTYPRDRVRIRACGEASAFN